MPRSPCGSLPDLFAAGKSAGHDNDIFRRLAKRRRSLIDELVCTCDVYTWKLLRRDLGRSRRQTEATILAMVTAIVSM